MTMYKVYETDEQGNLNQRDLESEFDSEGREPADFLGDIVEHHYSDDPSSVAYEGWQTGAYEFSYEYQGEERTVFLACEEVD
jgi:hypothetical protein